jgi:hypothetical protein
MKVIKFLSHSRRQKPMSNKNNGEDGPKMAFVTAQIPTDVTKSARIAAILRGNTLPGLDR